MAIDTRAKRASVLGVAMAATLTLPAPDSTVGQPDRQGVAYAYSGIEADEYVPPPTFTAMRMTSVTVTFPSASGLVVTLPTSE